MAGYRKLGRTSNQRKAMIRGQVTSLLYNGNIVTTEARAKEVKKVAEGLIALLLRKRITTRPLLLRLRLPARTLMART